MRCVRCCRNVLSFIIILNMFLGLAIVGLLVWLYLDGAEFWTYLYGFNVGPVIGEIEYFNYISYALVALGAIKVFMSFISCCSVSRKFIIPVILVFAIQIVAAVCVWQFKDAFTKNTTGALTHFVKGGYESMNTTTDLAFDRLQAKSKCCGSMAPSDWSIADFNLDNEDNNTYQVPTSCCVGGYSDTCNEDRTVSKDVILEGTIYTEGCIMKLLGPIYHYIYRYETLAIVAMYLLLEFIVMALKVLACRSDYDDYDDSNMIELKPYR